MNHNIQNILSKLNKADCDAFYYLSKGTWTGKEKAFKVLQERVYPAIEELREAGHPIPKLLSRAAN